MGQKVNPIGLRLGINRTWDSRWYANSGEYADLLHEDIKIRKIEVLRKDLQKIVGGEVFLNLVEVRKPEVDANLVAESIAQQLERRVAFRRAMKRSMQTAMRMGAKGCKIICGGRLGGAEIARTEQYQEGSVPLHTLRADIDYGTAEAMTAMGIIGIKVWVYKGEILEHDPLAQERRLQESGEQRARTGSRAA